MRVVTGSLKGRTIKAVPGSKTRPTSDKVKESAFHIMGPYFTGGIALDLFAGSGALGIEAISRGIEEVVFIDHSQPAIKTIRKNVAQLQIEDSVQVYRNDAVRALEVLAKKNRKFDMIFIDPPYEEIDYNKILTLLENKQLMNDACFIYVEHLPKMELVFNEEVYDLVTSKQFSNAIAITILQHNKSTAL